MKDSILLSEVTARRFANNNPIGSVVVVNLFKDKTIGAGLFALSDIIDLEVLKANGALTLQIGVSGSGTLKITAPCCLNGVDFLIPTDQGDIITEFTALSGTSGKDIITVTMPLVPLAKLLFTETSGTNNIIFSAWIGCQR